MSIYYPPEAKARLEKTTMNKIWSLGLQGLITQQGNRLPTSNYCSIGNNRGGKQSFLLATLSYGYRCGPVGGNNSNFGSL